MSQPFDSCRLYFTLRNRAWAHPGSARQGTFGLIDIDREIEHPDDVGLSRDEMLEAIKSLEEANLLHEITSQEADRLGLEHHQHRVYVEVVDDLTAATILMSCC